ncbi:hypothetical protein GCM10010392_00620 [Streptomyces clavifer]|nr:hypothetical protein GCM10010392_00620 [Streptomyces clavifer]
MHRIFQEDPGIFTGTFRTLGIPFPDPVAVSLLPTDLTETKPLERRVDTLLRVDTADGDGYLLAVEAQVRKDPAKHSSWTYYLAHLNAKYGIGPVLLVVCQDESTARWAARPIRIGPPAVALPDRSAPGPRPAQRAGGHRSLRGGTRRPARRVLGDHTW